MAISGGAALGTSVANDIAYAALTWYIKGDALTQTTQDKPLIKFLKANQKTFASGKGDIQGNVQFRYMADTAGFLQGFSEDDSINFGQSANIVPYNYAWKEVIASLIITWTELLKDGISITDDSRGGKKSTHSGAAQTRITELMKNRMDDFGESWMRAMNFMFWADGTQDAKQVPGVLSFLTDNPAAGVTGAINRATYPQWRNRANLGLVPSPANTSTVQFLNSEITQLKRYGGKPNKALCGSAWLDGLRSEVFAKGFFTMDGWGKEKATDLGMAGLHIPMIGKFEYDPTMDALNLSKRCYIFDSRRLKLKPMEGEDNKVLAPERPYQYLVFLHSVKWTGALICDQLSGMGVYSFA